MSRQPMPDDPFDPDNAIAYTRWRTAKLAAWPPAPEALVTELARPDRIGPAEHERMLDACRRPEIIVLHMRTGFNDGPGQRRTFYRARFYERIAGT